LQRLSDIDPEPMSVKAILLPQAKLQFGDGVKVNPNLAGSWNFEGKKFAHGPPNSIDGGFKYAVLIVQPPSNYDRALDDFIRTIERDTKSSGLQLISGGPPIACGDRTDELMDAFARMKTQSTGLPMISVSILALGKMECSAVTLSFTITYSEPPFILIDFSFMFLVVLSFCFYFPSSA
jgi:hypothetical protein